MTPTPAANPFRALEAYSHRDRERLFGRDGDLCLFLDRVLPSRTTLLFAGSGVGKTSFLNAKLVPELEERYFVVQHGRWATDAPLLAVERSVHEALARRENGRRRTSGDGSLVSIYGSLPTRSVLVLDQFEELFQHHRDTAGFDTFIEGITALINTESVDVRVVFSMREEFLGELSVFDNRIPDLFNNYYRLKNPTARQAREIVALTANAAGVSCDRSGLDALIGELLTVQVGVGTRLSRPRDHVSPPFLQIVCHRLWETQFETLRSADAGFLAGYSTGSAHLQLQAYCREKLDALPMSQRDLAADAFAYLMTRQGAKMAYELGALAEHMEIDEGRLLDTLGTLAQPNVRILRESAGAGGSRWFELYHDMYAPFLASWRADQLATRRRRQAEEARQRTEREVAQRVTAANPIAVAVVSSVFALALAPLVLLILLRRAGHSWRNGLLATLGWIAGWFSGFLIAMPFLAVAEQLGASDVLIGVVVFAAVLLGGPLGTVVVFWKVVPRTNAVRRRSVFEYALFGLLAMIANFQYAITPSFSVDLSPVTPLIVVYVAFRFGPVAAGIFGALIALIGVLGALALGGEDIVRALMRGSQIGPYAFPHSSLGDLIRLVTLGVAAGWLFNRLRDYVGRRSVAWGDILAAAPGETAAGPFWASVHVVVAIVLLFVADVYVTFSVGPDRLLVVPPRNLVLVVALIVGYRLGPHSGALAAALAMTIAWLVSPFVHGPLSGGTLWVDYRHAGHVVSLAFVAYWGGVAAGLAGTRAVSELARWPRSALSRGPDTVAVGVSALVLLVAASLYVTSASGGPGIRVGLEPLLGVVAAMVVGATLGETGGAWLVAITVVCVNFIVSPLASDLLPSWTATPVGPLRLRLGTWSTMGLVTLTATAWLAGRFAVQDSAQRRRWLAIAAFAALELAPLVQNGMFPRAYITGTIFRWEIDMITGPLRVFEPLLVAALVGAVVGRFGQTGTPVLSGEAYAR